VTLPTILTGSSSAHLTETVPQVPAGNSLLNIKATIFDSPGKCSQTPLVKSGEYADAKIDR
jgi:hypothetical protein